MIKTLIAYASKSNTAAQVAHELSSLIVNSTFCDLTKEQPSLEEYDCVVLGSGIRVGKFHKAAQQFVKNNEDTLLGKPVAYYITNCFPDSVNEIFEGALPENLRNHALAMVSVGGQMDIDKLKGMDKMIATAVMKATDDSQETTLELDEQAIKSFADLIISSCD